MFRNLIFDYSKTDDFYKKSQKNDAFDVITIKAPDFWEKDKLLNFLSVDMDIFLDFEAKEYFLKRPDCEHREVLTN